MRLSSRFIKKILKQLIRIYLNVLKSFLKFFNPNYLHSRINNVFLNTNGNVIKKAGNIFTRGQYVYSPIDLLNREVLFLKKLNGVNAPLLINRGKDWIEMENCGEILTRKNLPLDWRKQISSITNNLSNLGIIHRDIKEGNVLVKNNKIYLIDFGWAVFVDEKYYISPRELTKELKVNIYDNYQALHNLVNSL
tara:strand:+ start:2521 stop:3099 length:579 start_codon:yes stop_codon:yes gene_type:complete